MLVEAAGSLMSLLILGELSSSISILSGFRIGLVYEWDLRSKTN